MSSGKREEILGRIREALRIRAPQAHDGNHEDKTAHAGQAQPRAWLPAVPPDAEGQLALFEKNCALLRADLRLAAGVKEAAETLASLRDENHWTSAAAHQHPLLDRVVPALEIETLYVERNPDPKTLERCSVGITACDALVAQTGSVVLTARSAGGRALSVLPPHHVVIAQADQLVPDLPAAFDLLYSKYGNLYPSFATFITGPSRTGDIERILVLGAHGPRNLTVIVIR
jgi:L-lactate dehydrogenase complex protein LldG